MPFEPFLSVAIMSTAAFLAASGAWWLARKAGLTDVQEAVREEQLVLATTLRNRVDHLEGENKRLAADIEYLKRENANLRSEVLTLQRELIKISRSGGTK
jgi:tRNA C32,U32 (ribose-2'-O)-methylase TrmJ